MAVDDVFRAQMEYAVWGQSFTATTYWQELASGSGTGTMVDLADMLDQTLRFDLQSCFGDDVIIGCFRTQMILPTVGNPWVVPTDSGQGMAGANTMTPNVTAIVNQVNAIPGNLSSGQLQLSGLDHSFVENGTLTAAFLAGAGQAVVDRLVQVQTSPGANDYQAGGYSTVLAGIPRVPPVFGLNLAAVWNGATRTRRTRNTPRTGTIVLT